MSAPTAVAITEGAYHLHLARGRGDLDEAARLRFEVFHLELGEGLAGARATGRDLDEFDEACDHLIVRQTETSRVVGTYRMQTREQADAHRGFYCATEFGLDWLPTEVLAGGVEVGRACIDPAFRNRRVLLLLWKGLAAYLAARDKRYLFGCCSLPGLDPDAAWAAADALRAQGAWHRMWRVPAAAPGLVPPDRMRDGPPVALPMLFRTYVRFGATVCGGPVLDRAFGTTDFLVVLDRQQLSPEATALFFTAGTA